MRPQVMSMVKFSPIALNFGYDFDLFKHFLGHSVYIFIQHHHCIQLCRILIILEFAGSQKNQTDDMAPDKYKINKRK